MSTRSLCSLILITLSKSIKSSPDSLPSNFDACALRRKSINANMDNVDDATPQNAANP